MIQVRRRTFFLALAVAVLAGMALGGYAGGRAEVPRPMVAAPSAVVQAPIIPVQMPLNTGTFAKVAETIKPAVVNITTLSKGGVQGRTPFEEFFGEEFFRRFFGDAPERIPQRSLGSGVIVDPSGRSEERRGGK